MCICVSSFQFLVFLVLFGLACVALSLLAASLIQ